MNTLVISVYVIGWLVSTILSYKEMDDKDSYVFIVAVGISTWWFITLPLMYLKKLIDGDYKK